MHEIFVGLVHSQFKEPLYDSHDIFHFCTNTDSHEFNLLPCVKSERKYLSHSGLTIRLLSLEFPPKSSGKKKGNKDACDLDECKIPLWL